MCRPKGELDTTMIREKMNLPTAANPSGTAAGAEAPAGAAPAAPNAAVVGPGISGTDADGKETSAKAKKKGRSALRIDLGAGNAGGPVGLNVPQG